VFTDGRALASHPDVDLVCIVVKVPEHRDLVAAALESRKHVFCEWPLGKNLDEALELAALAEAEGVVHMIGLQARQSPALLYARDLIGDGVVGRVLSCDLYQGSDQRGGASVPAGAVWSTDRHQGRTLLTIQGGHSLDALEFCLGSRFASVASVVATRTPSATVVETGEIITVDTPDQVMLAAVLESDVPISVHMQGGAPSKTGFRLDVHGDLAALTVGGKSGVNNSDLALSLSKPGEPSEEMPIPTRYMESPLGDVPANPVGNVARAYAQLAQSIASGSQVMPNFRTAVGVHRLLEAVQRASDGGVRVTLPKTNGTSGREHAG
jgi:predicted dehydrogenase